VELTIHLHLLFFSIGSLPANMSRKVDPHSSKSNFADHNLRGDEESFEMRHRQSSGTETERPAPDGHLTFVPQPNRPEGHLQQGRMNYEQFLDLTRHSPPLLWAMIAELQTMSAMDTASSQTRITMLTQELETQKLQNHAQIEVIAAMSIRHQKELESMAASYRSLETVPTQASARESDIRPPGDPQQLALRMSYRLSDPPRLSNGRQPDFDLWCVFMRLKMRVNADRMDTEEVRMAYVASRCTGDAAQQLAPRLRDDAPCPFRDAEEMLQYLELIYAPALQSLDAHVEFTELKMKYEQSFEAFFRKFILLAAQSGKDVNDGTLKFELWHKLTQELRDLVNPVWNDQPVTFQAFVQLVKRCVALQESSNCLEPDVVT
jgi:hypothetical protein